MAREDFARVVRRISLDPSFAQTLHDHPEKAIGGLSLTSSELKALKGIDPDLLAMLVDSLDRRIDLPSVRSTNGCTGGTNGCTASGGGGVLT
jgi:hypothetical protein